MIEIGQTMEFVRWFEGLTDRQTRACVLARVRRLSLGNFGDTVPVGEGVLELRIHHGPGYRVYLARMEARVVVLLAGGVKRTQDKDIRKAKELAKGL